jgi:cytoskeleton protein RodZ
MGPFGERMQREREMRGITLDEIAEGTKITVRCLRAIEREEFSKLPGGIFNKGFVRAYARYIGIDEEQAVTDFLAASGHLEPPLPTADEIRAHAPSPALPSGKALAGVAVLVVLVFGLSQLYPEAKRVIVQAWADVRQPPAVSATEPSTVSAKNPATPPPAAVNQDEVAPASLPVTDGPGAEPAQTPASETQTSPAETQTSPSETPTAPSETQTPPSETPSTSSPATPDTAGTSADPPKAAPRREFMVQIRAKKDSWISIAADGKVQSEGMMAAPAERVVRARNRVVLKMGNAAGLQLSHNGRVLPPMSGDNQVTTLVFTADGVQR